MWAYAERYKGLTRSPAEPAEPAGIVTSQWVKDSRLVAAPPATCCTTSPSDRRTFLVRDACVLRGDAVGEPPTLQTTSHYAHSSRPDIVDPNRAFSAPAIDITVQTTAPSTCTTFGIPKVYMVQWSRCSANGNEFAVNLQKVTPSYRQHAPRRLLVSLSGAKGKRK
jgi:hypothetical protein